MKTDLSRRPWVYKREREKGFGKLNQIRTKNICSIWKATSATDDGVVDVENIHEPGPQLLFNIGHALLVDVVQVEVQVLEVVEAHHLLKRTYFEKGSNI